MEYLAADAVQQKLVAVMPDGSTQHVADDEARWVDLFQQRGVVPLRPVQYNGTVRGLVKQYLEYGYACAAPQA